MKVSPFRLVELLLSALACITVGSAISAKYLGGADLLAGQSFANAAVAVSVAWLLALVFMSKQLPRI